jgi:hypothetical protein
MKLIEDSGNHYLECEAGRVRLHPADLGLFTRMTPMGRKVTLRRRAVERMAANPIDAEARVIFDMLRLPARDWDFRITA